MKFNDVLQRPFLTRTKWRLRAPCYFLFQSNQLYGARIWRHNFTMENSQEHRINLRLPNDVVSAVDSLRKVGTACFSMNKWVLEAIREKIMRDTATGAVELPVAPREGVVHTFYEFFAGGGMARAGLGIGWNCLFANDFSAMKGHSYRKNWGGGLELVVEDVNKITSDSLPASADLVWASFPCQDLSLAGTYSGIGHRDSKKQTRSGTFWPFWRLVRDLQTEERAPSIVVLENVYGALTSHEGRDFSAIASAFSGAGYKFGALVIDARHFVPQSRPRVFIIGVHNSIKISDHLALDEPGDFGHPAALRKAYALLSKEAQKKWIWWKLPKPISPPALLADIIEDNPIGVSWHSTQETDRLLSLMTPTNLEKVSQAKAARQRVVGTVYRRTRTEEDGIKHQRAEVRFDGIAGCLRTPSGGSSRQLILVVDGERVRSRLLSAREAARLMGLSDEYVLPENYNDAYHIAGDGVVVPVVRHLATHLFEPILEKKIID